MGKNPEPTATASRGTCWYEARSGVFVALGGARERLGPGGARGHVAGEPQQLWELVLSEIVETCCRSLMGDPPEGDAKPGPDKMLGAVNWIQASLPALVMVVIDPLWTLLDELIVRS